MPQECASTLLPSQLADSNDGFLVGYHTALLISAQLKILVQMSITPCRSTIITFRNVIPTRAKVSQKLNSPPLAPQLLHWKATLLLPMELHFGKSTSEIGHLPKLVETEFTSHNHFLRLNLQLSAHLEQSDEEIENARTTGWPREQQLDKWSSRSRSTTPGDSSQSKRSFHHRTLQLRHSQNSRESPKWTDGTKWD